MKIDWIRKGDCHDMSDSDLERLQTLLADSPLLKPEKIQAKPNGKPNGKPNQKAIPRIQVEISKRIPSGSTILNATVWNMEYVAQVKTPTGFPRLALNTYAERELLLVEILQITSKSGGMTSYFGYCGDYYSLIVDLSAAQILDVRGEKMT